MILECTELLASFQQFGSREYCDHFKKHTYPIYAK